MDIKTKKKKLIYAQLEKNPDLRRGMKTVSTFVLTVFLLRLAFMLYEIIFFSASGVKIGIVSNLLILPLLIILYMIFDGNRAFTTIPAISAVVRVAIYFSDGINDLEEIVGANAYTAVFLAVMIIQFSFSLIISYAPNTQKYFSMMQSVNMQLQKEFLSGGNNKRR